LETSKTAQNGPVVGRMRNEFPNRFSDRLNRRRVEIFEMGFRFWDRGQQFPPSARTLTGELMRLALEAKADNAKTAEASVN